MQDLEEIRETLNKPETENAKSEIETLQSRVFELEQKLNLSSFGEVCLLKKTKQYRHCI
jgi:hypothetical protein